MRFLINDTLAVNDWGTGAFINGLVEGLELPQIRSSSGNYAGVDGGYISSQLWAMRLVTLSGVIVSPSGGVQLEERREAVIAALQGKAVKLQIVTWDGRAFVVNGKLADNGLTMPRNPLEPSVCPLKIDIICPDPIIYDDTAGGELTASISKIISGGYTFPITYPYTYAPSTPPSNVNLGGTVPIKPIITLTGVMANPVLTNRRTGLSLHLADFATTTDDEVIIDMAARTVTLNGGSIFYKLTGDSRFWSLLPGDNPIALETAGGGDTVTGEVSWRSGVMGI